MNKWAIFAVILIIGIAAYVKLNEPKVADSGNAQQSSDVKFEADQQALPDSAKGLVDEIKKEHEKDEFISQEDLEMREQENKLINEMEEELNFETEMREKFRILPVDEIPTSLGSSGLSLKWPCKNASFAQIMDSFNTVWGKNSVKPHDSLWFDAISNGLADYAVCRAMYSNDISICDRLEPVAQSGENSFEIANDCRLKLSSFYLQLYSLKKTTRELCYSFRFRGVNDDVCALVPQKRGHALCDSIPMADDIKPKCFAYIPESESDCNSLQKDDAAVCRENLQVYNAIKFNNPKLCPPGLMGVVCLSYFNKNNPQYCDLYMQKLSKNFCSGGKYSATRRINLNPKSTNSTDNKKNKRGGTYAK